MPRLDLSDAASVCEALQAGARALRQAPCRCGSMDRISAPGTLIATGDLHDNPRHLATLAMVSRLSLAVAALDAAADVLPLPPRSLPGGEPVHLVLHEIIHSDRLINGLDFSYRALARVAALKAHCPERVHVLLANHELAQVCGAGIVKEGVRVVEAFNNGVARVFGADASRVLDAVGEFIRAMPLALRCICGRGREILVSHSLPSPWMMGRFDATVLERDLRPEDYEPGRGAAHLMVWGRGYDAEQLEDLVETWGVNMFIVGHEYVPEGARFVPPCALVLNSDHARGVYVPIDLNDPPSAAEAASLAVPLESPPAPAE